MAVILGLASAAVYGTADFFGGLATRRAGSLAVVVWSQLTGLIILIAAVVAIGSAAPRASDLWWGAAGGLGGGAGVILLYRGLAIGRMSVVAPTTAVGAAALPVLVGIALGDRPGVGALLGVVVALVAIVLVSSVRGHGDVAATPAPTVPLVSSAGPATGVRARMGERPGIAEAIGAGIGFGFFFTFLGQASGDAELWPLLAARSSVLVAAGAAAVTRTSLRAPAGSWPLIALVGVLDMTANLLYLFAERRGLLSLVAVLVSLYPAATVLLARVVLSERLSRMQLVGLVAAAAGIVLIGVGA